MLVGEEVGTEKEAQKENSATTGLTLENRDQRTTSERLASLNN